MEWFDTHMSALDSPLEQAPEVLNAVGMDIPSHVLFRMIDNLVGIVSAYLHIGIGLVTEQGRSRHHMLTYSLFNQSSRGTVENRSPQSALRPCALHPNHHSFPIVAFGAGILSFLSAVQ